MRKRIGRLLSNDVIRLTAVANPLKLDYPVIAIFSINAEPGRVQEVAASLQLSSEFRFIGLTTGEFDFVTEAWFRDFDDLRVFLTQRLQRIEGVTRVHTAHVLELIRYAYDWGASANGIDGAGRHDSSSMKRP